MSSFSGSRSARRGDRHGWTSFDAYLSAHHSHLDRFRDFFVDSDELTYFTPEVGRFEIRGRVHCQHGLFIDVEKTLEVNELRQVRTIRYKYHAGMAGEGNRPIFRYDNAHRYARERHDDEYHKHRFDHSTWHEIKPPIWVGRERWPHLSDVIEELIDWWEATGQYLDRD